MLRQENTWKSDHCALACNLASDLQMKLETGEIGRQANGAIMATMGETVCGMQHAARVQAQAWQHDVLPGCMQQANSHAMSQHPGAWSSWLPRASSEHVCRHLLSCHHMSKNPPISVHQKEHIVFVCVAVTQHISGTSYKPLDRDVGLHGYRPAGCPPFPNQRATLGNPAQITVHTSHTQACPTAANATCKANSTA